MPELLLVLMIVLVATGLAIFIFSQLITYLAQRQQRKRLKAAVENSIEAEEEPLELSPPRIATSHSQRTGSVTTRIEASTPQAEHHEHIHQAVNARTFELFEQELGRQIRETHSVREQLQHQQRQLQEMMALPIDPETFIRAETRRPAKKKTASAPKPEPKRTSRYKRLMEDPDDTV